MDQILDKTYRLAANVQVGKFTVVVLDSGTFADGCAVPSGANASNPAGVVQSSIIPSGFADYSGGQYVIVSGTAWPAGAVPTTALGRNVRVRKIGISHCVASAAIARGDYVNIADNQGRIKTITETSTTVFEVGQAEEAAANAGDVIRVRLTLVRRLV